MLINYIIELKNRFMLILITWITTLFTCYFNKEVLLYKCIEPSINYQNSETLTYFISTDLAEIFTAYVKVTYFFSNQMICIYAFFQFFMFITPALYKKEYYTIKFFFVCYVILWAISIFILYKIAIPLCWKFFVSFFNTLNNQSIKIYFEAKIMEYLNFFIKTYLICNVSIQVGFGFFIFFDFLHQKIHFIKNFRKIFYFLFIITATCITPPDLTSQAFVALLFLFFFEMLVLIIILKNKIINGYTKKA